MVEHRVHLVAVLKKDLQQHMEVYQLALYVQECLWPRGCTMERVQQSQSFFDLAGPNWNSWSEKTGTMKVVISARSYKEAFERHVTHVPDEMGQYWRFIRIYIFFKGIRVNLQAFYVNNHSMESVPPVYFLFDKFTFCSSWTVNLTIIPSLKITRTQQFSCFVVLHH